MIHRSLLSLALAFVLSAGFTTSAIAQETKPNEPAKQEPKKEEPKKDPKTVDYERFVKDLKRADGPMPMYVKGKSVYIEVPEAQLGKLFLVQAALGTGASSQIIQAGEPIGATEVDTFFFERNEDNVWLVRPNLRYRWDANDPLAIASERSFPRAVLGSYKIVQQDPEAKKLLIDMTNFFTGDLFQLNEMINLILGGQFMPDREKSGPEHAKGFPENTVLRMKQHYFSPRGTEPNMLMLLLGLGGDQLEDGRSLPLKVTYNLWYRKDSDYVPRLADPRVGYFTNDHFSVDKFLNDERTQRYIMRWNLKKKDPTAAMSEPVKPIVWTLDPSIPKEWRPAVKEGVLRWNKAFEALGYKNAVQVQDVPESEKDFDHADGRYNVIRFTMSESAAYAVSQVRTDPFTGEILNAAITFDANMLSFIMNEHQKVYTPTVTARQLGLKSMLRDPERKVPVDAYLFEHEESLARVELEKHLKQFGMLEHRCEYSHGLAADAAYAMSALNAAPGVKISKENYARQFVADTIAHEVGHCLGLRHNFVASAAVTTEQLANDSFTSERGIAASVMDYNPTNVQAVLKGSGNFFMPTIGQYDVWAIKYGYQPIPVKDPLAEKFELSKIASLSGQPGHAFMTDEEADQWDPYVVRFDSGANPVTSAKKNLLVAQRTLRYAIDELPKPGESYNRRTVLVMSSISKMFKEGRYSARFVGGIQNRRNFKADAGAKPTLAPVDSDVQREAVSLIAQNLLSEKSFDLPTEVLVNLSTTEAWTAPVRDYIASQQSMMFSLLMSADTTERILENEYKLADVKGTYTLSEHFGKVMGAVFSEVGQNKSISPLRRDLQRYALNALTIQAGAPAGSLNDDVKVLASGALRRLSQRYGEALKSGGKVDTMTREHLRDSKELIDRFLARSVSAR